MVSEEGPAIECAKCGAENPPQARFCGSCGNLLVSTLKREEGPVHSL
ncbi:MAG TPA: zinc-ribbon domain-containing protein, partial [Firmicutes bacterium]|nr:zinc-ribbon domain-containing protein [Bacillota bacterium]